MERNIVLIGMPGCGKSVIGRRVAERLKISFLDLDKYIEQKEGLTIPEIFQTGEEYFRELEKKAVREIAKIYPQVIATGGGVVLDYDNIKTLREKGLLIFINRPVDLILSDLDISRRPLLAKGREEIFNLYEQRIELYKKYSDYEVINSGAIGQTVNEIVSIAKAGGEEN